jgi:hypothetical protein
MKQFTICFSALIMLLLASCSFFNSSEANMDLIPVELNGQWGYIDRDGNYVINPQFESADIFRGGVALVKANEKFGFIDEKGNYTCPPRFKDATGFFEGIAWVVEPDGPPTAIDKDGKTLFQIKDADIVSNYVEGLCRVWKEGDNHYYKFINRKGETVITGLNADANFSEGLVRASNGNKHGYMNKKGEVVINYQFDSASDFYNGTAVVKLGKKYGVIDKNGKYVINPQFDRIWADKGLYIIKIGEKYGWCDEKGKILINPQFKLVDSFGDNDLAPAQLDEQWGYIDREGKWAVNPQFDHAFSFSRGMACVSINEQYGFIDKAGKYVINPQFSSLIYWYDKERAAYAWQSVATDYVDVESFAAFVTKLLASNKVDGMKVTDTTIGEFEKKYQLPEEKTVSKHEYSKEIDYTITARGRFYKEESDGWWGTVTKFAPIAKLDYVSISFSLSGKAKEKQDKIYRELKKILGTDDGQRIGGQCIKMTQYTGGITIHASDKPLVNM